MGRRTATPTPRPAVAARTPTSEPLTNTTKDLKLTAPEAAPETEDPGLPMSFESTDSSTIAGASYDPDSRTLTVDFKGGMQHQGAKSTIEVRRYQYPGFELADWQQFLAAPSKGKFFSEIIRPIYVGREVKEIK